VQLQYVNFLSQNPFVVTGDQLGLNLLPSGKKTFEKRGPKQEAVYVCDVWWGHRHHDFLLTTLGVFKSVMLIVGKEVTEINIRLSMIDIRNNSINWMEKGVQAVVDGKHVEKGF